LLRFKVMTQVTVLFFILTLAACAYQVPPQPTAFITRQEPDLLSEILSHKPLPVGRVAVLGGQILRRYDAPTGRYFLIRDLPLDQDAYPHPPAGKVYLDPQNEFILFTPAMHVIGEHRPKKPHLHSSFVVFGREENRTISMGPGHILTAVGEVRGMAPFPTGKKHHHYLLIVSQYVMLWSKARPEDYPLVIK